MQDRGQCPACGHVFFASNPAVGDDRRAAQAPQVTATPLPTAFGRALEKEPIPRKTVCMAFHDQTPILRIQEVRRRAVARRTTRKGKKKKKG